MPRPTPERPQPPAGAPPAPPPKDATLERLAFWLDRAFRLPGTEMRFGLDALIGLVPGVGDTATALLAGAFVVAGWRMGARKRVLAGMALNIGLDWLIGTVPLFGDIFDVAWRANTRNLALLGAEAKRREGRRPTRQAGGDR